MSRRALCVVAAFHVICAARAGAQAVVPEQGEGSVSLTFQNYYVTGHLSGPQGIRNTNGATHAKTLIADMDFGLTDNLALSLTLPFVSTKYTGPQEYFVGGIPTHPGPLDDGSYHGTFQDFGVEVRRMWWAGPIPVAPFVGVSVPSHDYAVLGEAVAGRGRRELSVGTNAGADLSRILPHTYVHSRYALLAAEQQHGFSSLRSLIELEGGYDVSSFLTVRGLANWQLRHKGPTVAEMAVDHWSDHDRFVVSSYLNVGGGVALTVRRNTELTAMWVSTVDGKYGAHVGRLLSISATWSFARRMGGFDEAPPVRTEPSQ